MGTWVRLRTGVGSASMRAHPCSCHCHRVSNSCTTLLWVWTCLTCTIRVWSAVAYGTGMLSWARLQLWTRLYRTHLQAAGEPPKTVPWLRWNVESHHPESTWKAQLFAQTSPLPKKPNASEPSNHPRTPAWPSLTNALNKCWSSMRWAKLALAKPSPTERPLKDYSHRQKDMVRCWMKRETLSRKGWPSISGAIRRCSRRKGWGGMHTVALTTLLQTFQP